MAAIGNWFRLCLLFPAEGLLFSLSLLRRQFSDKVRDPGSDITITVSTYQAIEIL